MRNGKQFCLTSLKFICLIFLFIISKKFRYFLRVKSRDFNNVFWPRILFSSIALKFLKTIYNISWNYVPEANVVHFSFSLVLRCVYSFRSLYTKNIGLCLANWASQLLSMYRQTLNILVVHI